MASSLPPILCAGLLREVDARLLEVLGELAADEWDRQTVAPAWTVRDVACHLLDTALRKLSVVRDEWSVERAGPRGGDDLAAFINRMNREGVLFYRRLSAPVLRDLLRAATSAAADFHESLDPFALAAFPVSWAGESRSFNWFDTARELTERWHHQQQIREATDRPGIMVPRWYHPVLDCCLRGLPHTYRDVLAPDGTRVRVRVAGDCGGSWHLVRTAREWHAQATDEDPVDAEVVIPQAIAWRVFTRGIARDAALAQMTIRGQQALGARVLHLTAVVA